MSKRATTKTLAESKPTPTSTANTILPAHRAFFKLGQRVKTLMGEDGSRKAAARRFAEAGSATFELAMKASLFSERYTLDKLARLGQSRTAKGGPIPRDMLIKLATVSNEKHQCELLEGIEQGRWTSRDLGAAIRRIKGNENLSGGPRIALPGDLASLLDQVETWNRNWIARHDRAWSAALKGAHTKLSGESLSQSLRRIAPIRAQLCTIAKAAKTLEKRLAKFEA